MTSRDRPTELSQDREDNLEKLEAARAYHADMLQQWERRLAELKVTNASLQEALALREGHLDAIEKKSAYLESTVEQLKRTIASNERALAWRIQQLEELEQRLASRDKTIQRLTEELEVIRKQPQSDP
jgi:chromosome segregation ATPase